MRLKIQMLNFIISMILMNKNLKLREKESKELRKQSMNELNKNIQACYNRKSSLFKIKHRDLPLQKKNLYKCVKFLIKSDKTEYLIVKQKSCVRESEPYKKKKQLIILQTYNQRKSFVVSKNVYSKILNLEKLILKLVMFSFKSSLKLIHKLKRKALWLNKKRYFRISL